MCRVMGLIDKIVTGPLTTELLDERGCLVRQ